MDLALEGRTYIVTGGTRGLGRAVAETLVGEGANVLVASRDPQHVEDAVSGLGERAAGVVADLTDPGAPEQLLEAAREDFGGLDGAFVSHGGPAPGPASSLDDDTLQAALDVATVGPIRVVRDIAAQLGAGGSIVVLTSTSSVQPIAGLASSNVARPAVWGYVKSLADELGPRGIRLNVLLPGRFGTERLYELFADGAEASGRSVDEVADESAASIPLRRIGDPEELGRVAAFLLSPAASYVTGAAWAVDGGVTRGL